MSKEIVIIKRIIIQFLLNGHNKYFLYFLTHSILPNLIGEHQKVYLLVWRISFYCNAKLRFNLRKHNCMIHKVNKKGLINELQIFYNIYSWFYNAMITKNMNERTSISRSAYQNALQLQAFQPKIVHPFGGFFPKNNATATYSYGYTLCLSVKRIDEKLYFWKKKKKKIRKFL